MSLEFRNSIRYRFKSADFKNNTQCVLHIGLPLIPKLESY